MSLTSLNDKYGIALGGLFCAGIWTGIFAYMGGLHDIGFALTTGAGLVGGVVSAMQVLIIRNQSVNAVA
jgi:hypothetical protein